MNVSYNSSISTYGSQEVYTQIPDNQTSNVSQILNLDTISSASNATPTYGSVNPPNPSYVPPQTTMSMAEFCLFSNSEVDVLS